MGRRAAAVSDQDILAAHLIVQGLVQGVGFRAWAHRLAIELGMCGTVRNLPDGSVEIWAEGSKEKLDLFIKKMQAGAPGRVDGVQLTHHAPMKKYKQFLVVF